MAMKMTMKKSAMKAKKASGMKKMMKSMAKKSTMMRRKAMVCLLCVRDIVIVGFPSSLSASISTIGLIELVPD